MIGVIFRLRMSVEINSASFRLIKAAACACFIGLLLPVVTVLAGPPKLNYFFPAGAQIGQSIVVTANGSWDDWPVTAWADQPGLQFTAEKEKGQLKVTVDVGVVPGTYWVRLLSPDGASSVKPFIVGNLPEVGEQEPNEDPEKPQAIERSTVINGRLGKRDDVDTFAITLTKGQQLVASMQANRDLGSTVDAVLQVGSSDHFVLEQNDDARGLDPLVVFTAPAEGRYLIRTFGFPATPDSSISFAGNDAFLYRLTLTTDGFVDHAIPMAVTRAGSTEVELRGWNIPDDLRKLSVSASGDEFVRASRPGLSNSVLLPVFAHSTVPEAPEDGKNSPQSVQLPFTASGVIETARDEDVYTFAAKKGASIEFTVESDQLDFLLDAALIVRDHTGKMLAEADDSSRRARDPELSFSAPADGEYSVTIHDVHGHGGPRYVYRLTGQESKPDFSLNLSADTFVVKRGGSVEITVAVDRGKGFNQDVEIAPVGLPSGVTATAMKSSPSGDSAKSIKLTLAANAEAKSGPFSITGKTSGELTIERRARLGGDGTLKIFSQAWITVTESK